MQSSMTLILGGARSGKSTYAEKLAKVLSDHVLYVATATAGDQEMQIRIERHRQHRPSGWRTLEAPSELGETIMRLNNVEEVVLIDCVTLWVSNLLMHMPEEIDEGQAWESIQSELDGMKNAMIQIPAAWILVSNEVGLGLVPPYPMGRLYRDVLGRVNQSLASQADNVIFMVAGIPLAVKGSLKTL